MFYFLINYKISEQRYKKYIMNMHFMRYSYSWDKFRVREAVRCLLSNIYVDICLCMGKNHDWQKVVENLCCYL